MVETNIHYPTDSSLLGDGARVLTRTMKKVEKQAGRLKRKLRDRTRSVNKRVRAIAIASRQKATRSEERRKQQYRELLRYSRQILNDTRRVIQEIDELSAKRKKGLGCLAEDLSPSEYHKW